MHMKPLFAALALVAAGTAQAGDAFSKLDADHSGTISQKEAAALPTLNKQWTQLDSNRDGSLDAAEFARFEMEESHDSSKKEDKHD